MSGPVQRVDFFRPPQRLRAAVANVQTAADLAAYYGGANDTLAELEKARSAADDLVDEVERLTAEVERLRAGNAEHLKVFSSWESLWNDKEDWEKAAKEAWQREKALSGLLRGMADRASKLRRQANWWHSRAEQEFRDRVADTAKAMAESGQQRAEVSRLRDQLAAQSTHKVFVRAAEKGWWKSTCPTCDLTQYSPSKQRAEDWKDQHEADTLRPTSVDPKDESLRSEPSAPGPQWAVLRTDDHNIYKSEASARRVLLFLGEDGEEDYRLYEVREVAGG